MITWVTVMDNKFHLVEYETLRNEVLELIRQVGELKKFFLLAVAVSIAWLLSESGRLDPVASFLGAWIPFFVTCWFSAHVKDITHNILTLGDYLKKLEDRMRDQDLGWMNTAKEQKSKQSGNFTRSLRYLTLLQVLTVAFALYYVSRFSFGLM